MRQFFEEQDGKLSMTRLILFIMIAGYVFSAGYIAITTRSIADMPWGMITLVAMLYGINTEAFKLNLTKMVGGQNQP